MIGLRPNKNPETIAGGAFAIQISSLVKFQKGFLKAKAKAPIFTTMSNSEQLKPTCLNSYDCPKIVWIFSAQRAGDNWLPNFCCLSLARGAEWVAMGGMGGGGGAAEKEETVVGANCKH